MKKEKILIIGSFYHPANRSHSTTAAEQLAELFTENNIPVITTTRQYKKLNKLFSTVFAIIKNRNQFSRAIVPLYGTPMSFIWQEIASRLLKILKKKIILIVHGGSIPVQMEKGNRKFLRALSRADTIVSPSLYIKDFLGKYHLQATLIENPLNISSYTHQQKNYFRPHLLWMRSFEDIYNPEMAVRVAAVLAKKYASFKMVMAGSNNGMLREIKEMISDYGLQDKIVLPGYLNHRDKIKYAKEFDIFICTNRVDNAPVTLIEAMALGLVVVSVNSGGVPYMIKNRFNGLLVNLDDDLEMASKIEYIIENPGFGRAICANAYTYSWQYDAENVLKKWESVLKY